jgi:hypothetical protein
VTTANRRRAQSAAYIQRGTPGLSLEQAQFESAIERRDARWHSLEGKQRVRAAPSASLEGSNAVPLPAHHAHVSLEGPQAADRRRPHVSTHGLSLEGVAPLRAALEHRQRAVGPPRKLIRRQGIGPALISTNRKRK